MALRWLLLLCAMLTSSLQADVHVSERTLTLSIKDEPETLDWHKAHTLVESHLLFNLMEGLVSYDGLKVVPALAESWRISPDQKTYIFTLKSGAKWSDGQPLKAEHFVSGWKRLLSPITAAPYAYALYDIEGAEDFNRGLETNFETVGIRAQDEGTLVVRLKYPLSYWINIPAFWPTFPIREDLIKAKGDSWTSPGNLITIGPYCLVSHDLNSNFILKPNAFYHGTRGNVDRINVRIVKDDQQAFNLYESGSLDFLTEISMVDLKKMGKRKDLFNFPHLKTEYLGFVTTKHPASNRSIRRAIAMAIDKEKLAKGLFGDQMPARSFVPQPLIGSGSAENPLDLPFDLKRARSELRSSGLYVQGKTIHMPFLYPDWDKAREVALFLQRELKQNLDIQLDLYTMDNQSFQKQLDLHAKPLFFTTWTADYPDPDNFMSVFEGDSGNNRTTWKDPVYDRILTSARISQNRAEREKYYFRLQKILLEEETVIVPLYQEPHHALVRKGVKGLRLNALDYLYLKDVSVN